MTNFNFLLNNLSYLSSEELVDRRMDSTCFRSAPVPPSFRLRLHPLRMVATLLLLLCLSVGNVWGTDVTGTINFGSGSGSLNINSASVSGNDSQTNSWTVTTVGTTSFTPNASYAQVGSSKNPATSITFTTTLAASQTITAMSAKFGGFSGTAGTITLKVGDNTIGTGSLSASTDVTVTATDNTKSGKVLTVTVTGISKGVKCYYISYTYSNTPACSNNVTINKGTPVTGSSFSLDKTGSQATCNGLTVTVSGITPPSHYHFSAISQSGVAANKVTIDNSAKTVTYAANTTGTSTINIAYEEDPQYTVTWVAGGNSSFHTQTSYTGTALTAPGTPDASTYCPGGKVFVGWTATEIVGTTNTQPADLFTSVTGMSIPATDKTYYAVFATSGSSSKTYSFSITASYFNSTSYAANNNEKTSTATATDASGATMDVKWTSNQIMLQSSAMQWQKNNGYIYNSTDLGTINSVTVTSSAGTFTTYYGTTSQPSSGTQGTGNGYFKTSVGNATGTTSNVAVNFTKTTTSYSNYATTCCTPLGSINGSISWPHPNEAVVSWDNLANVSSWTVKYKTHAAGDYSTWAGEQTVYTKSTTNDSRKVTITGLTPCTNYDFQIIANPASGYCDKGQTIEDSQTHNWTVTSTGVTNATASPAIPTTTCPSGFSTTVTAAAGYDLPSTISVSNASHTWNQATGALTVNSVTGNVSITITPTVHTYTITYKDKGGGAFTGTQTDPPTTHTYGTATTLKIPTKENYSFGGWFTDSDCESGAVGNASSATLGATAFTADITLYAKWVANTHTVTYASNGADGGSVPVDAKSPYNHGANVTVLGNTGELTKTHYSFGGWSDGVTTYEEGEDFDISDDVTLSAVWNCAEYVNVSAGTPSHGTFSLSATGSRYTCEGAQVITVTPSANTGYAFSAITQTGVNSGVTIDNNAKTVTYAQWANGSSTINVSFAAKTVTVTWNGNGGTASSASSNYTYDGSSVTLATASREGYDFAGWWTAADGGTQITEIGTTNKPSADIEYFAHWTIKHYTVTWSVNGSPISASSSSTDVTHGNRVASLPTDPADNTLSCANKFMGWSAKSAGSTPKTTSYYDDLFTDVAGSPEITGNTTFYAVFAEVDVESTSITSYTDGYYYLIDTYGDKYFAMNGSVSSSKVAGTNISSAVTYNSSAKTITLDLENATLASNMIYHVTHSDGVYEIEATDNNKITSGSDANLTQNSATAKWNGLETSYNRFSFTYSYIDKSDTKYRTILYANGQSGFKNYATSHRDGSGYGAGYFYLVPAGTTSNYVTQCDANIVKVTYNANGGSTSCTNTTTDKTEDYTVCSTPPTRDYYTFAGWLCSADDKVYAANETIEDAVIDADFTLTAQWTPVTYNITYELDGGTNNVGNPATYNVTTATITLQDPTKGHDRFDGWYKTYSAGVYSNPVTSIPLGSHGDITLYAKWAARHEIVFDADGATTTIYRAEDEALNASVAGQGSIPANPSAPSACSSKVFVGWVAEEIDGETDDEPTFLDVTSKVNADKHYYAVWATSVGNSIAAVEDESFTGGEYTSYFAKTYGLKSNDKYVYKNSIWTSSDMTAGTKVKIKVKHLSNSSAATLTIALINSSGTVVTSTTLSTTANSNNIDNAAYSSNVELIATTAVTGYQITLSNIGSSSGVVILAATREVVATRSAYSTSCCATNVTLSENSPEHGTIEFGKTKVGTCGDKEVSLTITPEAGYQLHSYDVATGGGKVATKSVSPAISLDNNSSAAQNITLTFADEANGAYDVTASFSLMTVTSWAWTMHDGGGAIPDPLNLYVGQSARLDVAYTPDGVDASKKTYTRNKDHAYINWVGSAYAGYSTISGKASTGENTTAVTFTHEDGPTKTVNVKVLPLPLTHFEDLVHGKAFADVVATISDNALSATKTTPTSDDWTTPNANDCEGDHLHLVGWIREDWPALVAYLNGTGDAPTTVAITGAGNDGSGHAYYIAAGASIDVQTFDGVTFYAVWAEIK